MRASLRSSRCSGSHFAARDIPIRLSSSHRLLSPPPSRPSARSFALIAASKNAGLSTTVTAHFPEDAESDDSGAVIDRESPFNEAAKLAQLLQVYQKAGLSTWGFVIYRCTYSSDSDWQRFLNILNATVQGCLRAESHLEFYHTLSWTVQSDPQTLEGASKDLVREHFKRWVGREIADLHVDSHELTVRHSQKFRYCLHVDEGALNSVIRDAPQPPSLDLHGIGFVNLIAKDGMRGIRAVNELYLHEQLQ
ncbi:hypothetical protein LTR49_024645 [Elasticomyces elasticus]|nr:hypothetical protein LTR49_024645 [Elasticomyces elasticus]